jgi:hypothetical protein
MFVVLRSAQQGEADMLEHEENPPPGSGAEDHHQPLH